MSFLDLSDPDTCPPHFSFTKPVTKRTLTGQLFETYMGLRLYLITGSKHHPFLGCNPAYVAQYYTGDYVYVPDLKEQLLNVLKIEIATSPFLKLKYNKDTQVVWGRLGITPAEEEWVGIVKKALGQ